MGSKFCELLTMLFTLLSFLVVLGIEHSWAVAAQKVQCIDGQLRNSLLGLPYLSYLDLSLIDFNRMPIPEFIGSLSNLKYLNLSNANFKGIVPDHLGNLSGLQSLDLSGNSFSLKANNLDWLSGIGHSWAVAALKVQCIDAGEDCCKWSGVGCNNRTGHVITLDLHSSDSSGVLKGIVPDHLGNLSSLQHLDLSGNSFSLKANNLDWLSGLSSLEVLDLGGVDLSNAVNWLHAINLLPSLTELSFFSCQLPILQQSLSFVNFTSLNVLDLSYNSFHSTVPKWLVESSYTLHHLNLTRCQLQGSIPDAFVNFTSLTVLDFSYNNLQGSIPPTLGLIQEHQRIKHSPLRELYLSYNKLNGPLEKILPQFSELVVLEVASNSLQGLITEVHLQNFSSLRVLDLSGNQLILNMSSNWTPAFQLQTLAMQILDLSFNRLGGELPDLSSKASLITLHLIENVFSGYLPHFPPNMVSLDVAGNEFFGPISTICDMMNEHNALLILILAENHLSGHLPDCWTYGKSLRYLDLSSNNFSGELPQSLMNCTNLSYLVLAENALSGRIPAWLGESLQNLVVLDLGSNVFEGNIPWQLCQLKYIMVLSLSSNLLSGRIPRCVNNFQVLAEKEAEPSHGYYLYLRYAKVELKKVMWIDSQRHGLQGECRSGNIEQGGQSHGIEEEDRHGFEDMPTFYISVAIGFFTGIGHSWAVAALKVQCIDVKGQLRESLLGLPYLSYLDLSSIDFNQVPIPEFIGSLSNLKYLDLSNANFKGIVPDHLGNLSSLQHLDLSGNSFSLKANNLDWLSGLSSLEVLDLGV
ncbi:hypothetical protein GH714_004623 [Hevea brasiliensis]|uniref:Leucine-rich repeat-containing N-terminal plant-type domain-containing protein n=1 Tax=Hevea brasiliensis TaxID=3981 RepID=A0A6A6L099_HEVBR|nr:hypothetical protein GH714_004623 [Hevea brasiliensis]